MTLTVKVTIKTGVATAWVRAMRVLRFVVGSDRAGRWAVWGALRFSRVYVGGKRVRP